MKKQLNENCAHKYSNSNVRKLTTFQLQFCFSSSITSYNIVLQSFFSIPGLSDIIFEYLNFENQRFLNEESYIEEGEVLISDKFAEIIALGKEQYNLARNQYDMIANNCILPINIRDWQNMISVKLAKEYERNAERISGNRKMLKHVWVLLSSINLINNVKVIHELNCLEAALLKRLDYKCCYNLENITKHDYIVAKYGGFDSKVHYSSNLSIKFEINK